MLKKLNKYLSLIVFIIGTGISGYAEDCNDSVSRPITQIYSLEAGGESVLDTYLSPLKYSGLTWGVTGKWTKVLPWNMNSWEMSFDSSFRFGYMRNQPKTAEMIDFGFSFRWTASHRFNLPARVLFTAGVGTGMNAGVLYLPGNGNNPASARAEMGIGLTAAVSRAFKFKNLGMLLRDEVYLPSLSVFFSPQYGETYYEIYIGNHRGLAHCGWWGNRFMIDNLLSLNLDIGPSALQVGYRLIVASGLVNHINTETVINSFVIGWIPGGLGIKDKHVSDKAAKINSLY